MKSLTLEAMKIPERLDFDETQAAKVGRAYVILTSDVMAYIERAVVQQTAKRMRSAGKVLESAGVSA